MQAHQGAVPGCAWRGELRAGCLLQRQRQLYQQRHGHPGQDIQALQREDLQQDQATLMRHRCQVKHFVIV